MADKPDTFMVEATINFCDPLNPGIGYQVKVTKRGKIILNTSYFPGTGEAILTFTGAVRVLTMYIDSVYIDSGEKNGG